MTKDAREWLRAMLSKLSLPQHLQGDYKPPSAHSMKATALSFLAKYGASEADRLVLGHHADTSGSLAVYSRDLQAKPLRALEQCLDAIRRKVFLPDVSRSGYFVVDRGIVGGDQALGPAQSLDDLDLLPQGVPPADAAGPSSSHESSWERVDVPLATGTGTADTSGFDPLAPPGSPVASQASLGEPNGDETAVTTGSQGSGSESSSSSSSSSSSDDEATARAPPPVLQPPVPWRAGRVVWRHTKTRKLHLVGLADSRLGASFTCGRKITSAYAPLVSTVVLQSDRCSQCDKGRHIRSVAQLNLEIKRQRVDRA